MWKILEVHQISQDPKVVAESNYTITDLDSGIFVVNYTNISSVGACGSSSGDVSNFSGAINTMKLDKILNLLAVLKMDIDGLKRTQRGPKCYIPNSLFFTELEEDLPLNTIENLEKSPSWIKKRPSGKIW
ncbi:hypothetical protein FQA39_LY01646 [Lamprigera yunnana]|nr:hypothetical protein FQA39_LY01646 [Lamprigera yunnana]